MTEISRVVSRIKKDFETEKIDLDGFKLAMRAAGQSSAQISVALREIWDAAMKQGNSDEK